MAWATRYIPDDVRGVDFGTMADFETAPVGYTELAAAQEITHETKQEAIERVVQKTGVVRGPEPFIPGPMSGPVALKLPVRGGSLAAGGRTTADWLTLAQYCGMSKTSLAGGVGTITGGTSSTVTADDADFTGYRAGLWILVNADKGSTDDLQLRMITDRSSAAGTTTLTVSPDWDTTPVASDDFFDLDVLTPALGEPGSYLGLDVYMGQGSTDRHRVRYLGAAGTFKIATTNVGELPLMEFAYMTDRWTQSEASRVVAIDTLADPRLLLADQLYFDSQCISFESLGFDPGTEMVPLPGQCLSAEQGRIGWFYKNHVPVFEFQPYWDAEWYALMQASTESALVYMNVNSDEDAWGFGMPAAQVIAHDPGSIADGLVGSTVEVKAVDPGVATDDVQLPLFSIAVTGA
jgi:hypothetical protein